LCSAVINLSPFLEFTQKRSNFELPFLRQKVTPVEITSPFYHVLRQARKV